MTTHRERPEVVTVAGNPDGVPDVFAWVAIGPDGDEGIMGRVHPPLPFVTGRRDLADLMGQEVRQLPPTGRRYELRRYALAEVVDEVADRPHRCATPPEGLPGDEWTCPGCSATYWAEDTSTSDMATIAWTIRDGA